MPNKKSSILGKLNPQQEGAVQHTNGASLIVAGPGSGKTRALTHKAAYLVCEKNVNPQNILLVTFTNKAAEEMKKRIKKLLAETNPQIRHISWAGTFHSIGARILRQHGKEIGIRSDFVIYDTNDSKTTIKKVIKNEGLDSEKIKARSVMYTISEAKRELINATEYSKKAYGYYQELTAQIYRGYESLLQQSNALDFGDLLFMPVRLLEESPSTLQQYQEKFNYILVDEYQDTNSAQYMMLKLLAAKNNNITVVGDPGQSIYGFRGANFKNILNFTQDYPNAKTFRLEQNYRSTQSIVKAAQNVISNNRHNIDLNLWTNNSEGTQIKYYEAYSETDEADYILKEIIKKAREKSQQSLSDFAILYRTNAQSRALEECFVQSGLPYRLVGGTRFYERREIKDVLALLRVILSPNDFASWERIEKWGKTKMKKYKKDLNRKPDIVNSNPLKILDWILEKTSYLDYWENKGEEEYYRLENVKELRTVAARFDSLIDFLENVALVDYSNDYSKKEAPNAVTLMTLHSAKGLEFPVVFIVGLEEGLLPHAKSLKEAGGIEEERRLCYVGMTRAKKELHLTKAQKRFYFGSHQYNPTSRFIEEIPNSLLRWYT